MKTIHINHLSKTEGHASFVGALLNNDFAQARLETEEGIRLLEGVLLGRKYYEAPIVTSRICGVCPVVHNLASIKALEQALNVKVTPEICLLRKMMLCGQWIHSHALHAFFFSFPDIIGLSNNFDLLEKYPREMKSALEIRNWGVELARIIGGRTVHPINSVVGGFNILPDWVELRQLMSRQDEILNQAKKLFDFAIKKKLPEFERPTNYVSLKLKNAYAMADGLIYLSDNKNRFAANKFVYNFEELIRPHEKVKRVEHAGEPIMVGALARINNNGQFLYPAAKSAWKKLKVATPCYNSMYNIWAQLVEIIHCLEEMKKLFIEYEKKSRIKGFENRLNVKFTVNPGKGYAVLEAPRGLLYHQYELNKEGNIIYSNIITPTAIFLANLEKDLELYLVQLQELPDTKRNLLIKTLIRAYDLCISCATH